MTSTRSQAKADLSSLEATVQKLVTEQGDCREKLEKLEKDNEAMRQKLEVLVEEKKLADKEYEKEIRGLRSEVIKLKGKVGQSTVDEEAVAKVVQKEVQKESETWAKVAGKNANPGPVFTVQTFTDLQDRRSNVIVRGVQESEAQDAEVRKKNDLKGIEQVATAAGLDPKAFVGTIEAHRRLGKKHEGVNYRPILVKFRSQDFREDVLKGSRHTALKAHNGVHKTRFRLDPDMSKEQKEKLEKMYEEARQKSKNDKKFYVVGKERPVMKSRDLTPEESESESLNQE